MHTRRDTVYSCNLSMSTLIFHCDAEVPIATNRELRSSDSKDDRVIVCVPLCVSPETRFSARSCNFELL